MRRAIWFLLLAKDCWIYNLLDLPMSIQVNSEAEPLALMVRSPWATTSGSALFSQHASSCPIIDLRSIRLLSRQRPPSRLGATPFFAWCRSRTSDRAIGSGGLPTGLRVWSWKARSGSLTQITSARRDIRSGLNAKPFPNFQSPDPGRRSCSEKSAGHAEHAYHDAQRCHRERR